MSQLTRLLLLAALWAASSSANAGEKTTILALGDSITAGGKTFRCYREFLVPALAGEGVDFIGPVEDRVSRHAGFGGKNTAFLRGRIGEIYREFPADIVLIHAGHNHFAEDEPVPKILADPEAIIEMIREINPDAIVLLAQVIPGGKLPKYSYIPELNKELEGLARRLDREPARTILVNQAEGFDWEQDTVEDRVHPNQSGARKMAEKWLAALQPVLK